MRLLEDQHRHAEKMEVMGRLAGGVAHDFNNLLTTILGNVSFLMAGPQGDPNWKEDLEEVKKAAQKAASLTSQLLAFTQRRVFQPKVLDLNSEIKNVEKILRRTIGEDIDVQIDFASDIPFVNSDSGNIQQILMNLAVNSRDAMPSGGTLRIRTENVNLKEALSQGDFDIPAGAYILITITDTGLGMADEIKAHIFEPFFADKDRGSRVGMGLGLATVYGLVKQNGGFIECESAVGQGTTFRIYFPCALSEGPSAPEKGKLESSAKTADKTILVLDDERAVRQLAARMLTMAGYSVLEAGSAAEAKKILETSTEAPSLLLSDVVLPDQNGIDFSKTILPLYPHLKTVFMSGYLDRKFGDFKIDEHIAFIQKPFNQEDLLQKISQVLQS